MYKQIKLPRKTLEYLPTPIHRVVLTHPDTCSSTEYNFEFYSIKVVLIFFP